MFKLEKIPKLAQYIFCGSLLGIGFVFPILWLMVILGISLFFYLILNEKNISSILFYGWLTFTIKTLWVNAFILNIKSSSWIDDGWLIGALLITCCWFLVSAIVGLSGLFFAGVISYISKYLNAIYLFFLIPFLWVISEILGSLFFSILTYGSGSFVNTNYSFGYIGYLLSEHQLLIFLASVGGVYLLSFTGALIGYCLYYLCIETRTKVFLVIVITLFFILIITDLLSLKKNTINDLKDVSVAIVDTKFSADMRNWSNLNEFVQKEIDEVMIAALRMETDYILLPEGIDVTEEKLQNYLPNLEKRPIIIGNGITETELNRPFLRANVYKNLSKVASTDKQYLVPVGEYMPLILGVTFKIFGLDSTRSFLIKENLIAGPLSGQESFVNDLPAILFCFDGAVPLSVKNILESHPKAPFVVYPISHAWFENSKILENQIDMMVKVHAVYNHINIVSAGNMVDGALYTKSGKKIEPEILIDKEWWKISLVNF